MSLSWRDRLLVSLAPGAVSWVRLRGHFKPRAIAKGAVEADPAYGREPWAGAIAALRIEAAAWPRNRADVTIVLSNHFVRYALLEAPGRGVSRDEEIALARFHFTRLHGERAAAWDVRVAPAERRSPRVASAIDRDLLDALRSVFPREARVRLASIQPYLVCAFNRWRGSFARNGAWLVLAEPGRVCLAMLAGSAWTVLQSARSGDPRGEPAAADWLAFVEREKQRAAVDSVPTTVLARARARVDSGAAGGWHIVSLEAPWVDGIAAEEREDYAMALHAA